MADDLLRQFFARADTTLSIGYEVIQELKRRDETSRESALTRLELELASWQADIDAHDAYKAALSEFDVASAVWQRVGSSSTKPEAPALPPMLPQSYGLDDTIFWMSLFTLRRNLGIIRDSIRQSLPFKDSFTSGIAEVLGVMSRSIGGMKERLDEDAANEDAANNEAPEPADPPSNLDELVDLDQRGSGEEVGQEKAREQRHFVTVEQMARLAHIGVPAMNNRLSQSRPDVEPIRPGGRKHNAYPWPAIREWMQRNWPNRPLPEDIQDLQKLLQSLPPL